jgi:chemotaxis protein histidine kinase CheA
VTDALREYFLTEAGAYLGGLARALSDRDVPGSLLAPARGLRGIANIARRERVFLAAHELENAIRAVEAGALPWSDDMRERVEKTVDDLGVLVAEAEPEAALEERARSAVERWRELATEEAEVEPVAADRDEFLAFAAQEVAAIEDALVEGLAALAANPMDREAFKSILRRQRALLGAARLDEIAAVAQALRAVEDISRVIAKMNVAIKDEWYDVFRCARQVMRSARETLERGEEPPENNALRRLRTYREELIDRYGDGEAVSATAPASDGLVQALAGETQPPDVIVPAAAAEPAAPAGARRDPTIEIASLIYDGEAALRRALELRSRVERAVEHDPDALAAVDEVFDLIRLALR